MITVEICGGLGNQLFQYALGRQFEFQGCKVQYDISIYRDDHARAYLLHALGLNLKTGRAIGMNFANEVGLTFHPEILKLKGDWDLRGYWQCEKYFENIAGVLRAEIRPEPVSMPSLAVANNILLSGERSCMLHIRRTDNLRATSTPYHGLLTLDAPYYQKAIAHLRSSVPGVRFFVFSDDADYLRNCVKDRDMTIVDHNAPSFTVCIDGNLRKTTLPGREVEDLWLMAHCRHAIIANSTFGWWGAWLHTEQLNRIVTAPDPWYATEEFGATDIIPARWTKVKR